MIEKQLRLHFLTPMFPIEAHVVVIWQSQLLKNQQDSIVFGNIV